VKRKKIFFEKDLPAISKSGSIKNLSKKFDKIYANIKKDVGNSKKTLNILDKKFKLNFKIKDLRKFKKYKTIALIGMGGSILGAEAIYCFFQQKIKKNIYFFNNLNENELNNFKKKENISRVLFIIISKSGNTIETLSNTFALNIIKKNSKNVIIISEKNNNLLFSLSKKFNLFFVEHNNYVGGRYSVLSEVGILPAYLMGINIFKIRLKILEILNISNKFSLKNNCLKITNLIKSKKFNNLIFLNYCPELEKFLYWSQQLLAESLGKNNKGLLPVVSNAPKDHHSLLQLYLDGPKDNVFYIFSVNKSLDKEIIVKHDKKFKTFLNQKKISKIKSAQKKALVKSLVKKNIPFREFSIKKINEETLGKLFSLFIVETIVIGKLLELDPFNQPAVEQVKVYTKKFLN
jgi:glucose-6-phosphate isomerase